MKPSQNQKTKSYLKPLLPIPKNNFHKVPLAEHICDNGICVPLLPVCHPSRTSPFSGPMARAAESRQQQPSSVTSHTTPRSGLRPALSLPLEYRPLSSWVGFWKCKAGGRKVIKNKTWNLGSWLCHFLVCDSLSLKNGYKNGTNLIEFFYD